MRGALSLAGERSQSILRAGLSASGLACHAVPHCCRALSELLESCAVSKQIGVWCSHMLLRGESWACSRSACRATAWHAGNCIRSDEPALG